METASVIETNREETPRNKRVQKLWHKIWKHKWQILGISGLLCILAAGPVIYALLSTRSDRYSLYDVPHHHVAIVFGAGVEPDGTPTDYLKKRLDTAAKLYGLGKADVLLLSGDNSTSHHNEPMAMQKYVESRGVATTAIVLDYAGFNTYDTCYRAVHIFDVHDAILVSHAYHLPRALTTCDHLGVASVGVAAENAGRIFQDYSVNYLLREVVSTDKALVQIVFKPQPTVLGKMEPIE